MLCEAGEEEAQAPAPVGQGQSRRVDEEEGVPVSYVAVTVSDCVAQVFTCSAKLSLLDFGSMSKRQ